MRAELTRTIEGEEVNGKDRIFSWFADQAQSRGTAGNRPVVCVMDGERALWTMLYAYLWSVVCILDLFHVMERIWQAAHCFYPEGSGETAKRNALQDKHLRAFEYLDTTGSRPGLVRNSW